MTLPRPYSDGSLMHWDYLFLLEIGWLEPGPVDASVYTHPILMKGRQVLYVVLESTTQLSQNTFPLTPSTLLSRHFLLNGIHMNYLHHNFTL